MTNRRMILSGFFFNPQGDHRMSWRHPAAPGRDIFGLQYFRELADAAERAKLDAIFLADHVAIWDSYESNVAHYANARLEPLTLLSALAAVTKDIGLIATASASYTEPYNLARTFASLDYISNGRAAWNVVTSGMNEEAMNFGRDGNIEHAFRYERAAEFLETAKALWDSIEDEALLFDKQSGFFANPALVHRIDHQGKHFKVRGPLNVPRPPQGYPVIVQAGSSRDGKDLAARHAEINFSLARSIEEGKKNRAEFDDRLAQYGRTPDSLKILPGILPIVAASLSEAEEKRDFLESLTPPRLAIDLVSSWVGMDLSGYPVDGPVPELPDESTFDGQRTNLVRVKTMAAQGMTIRQIASQVAKAGTAPMMSGTPKQIADEMEAWFTEGAADGFNLMFPVLPEDWTNFCRDVVPELQGRGLVQTEYKPGTLRDKLGLKRPLNSLSRSA
ncbi:FMN-dependent oxidoreductase (nitrilotriacetate monooxygenase family) [Rhizobium sp. BK313]|uniref:LLM class flavin-dependent oxidoreductase n=1 Tax=Rhizobium sp. BK313 TaxID=2587081 RepID=UPI0010602BC5|nr:LLM class flavin-dependent oxidoreductase [Rhizobium sp. BK313]MBB3458550.1 FMN-dependent oxidoreductase (nitrilotriacetate monooxygenase family) [Rhizobium sp. BK313]